MANHAQSMILSFTSRFLRLDDGRAWLDSYWWFNRDWDCC